MADYKKKRKKLIKANKRSARNAEGYEAIRFGNEQEKPVKRKSVGRKRNATPFLAVAVLCVIIALAYFIITTLHPVGVVEYFKSAHSAIGSGEGYDVDIEGGKPSYTLSTGDKYYIVTASSVNCYNINGKTIFERPHSFTQPVVKYSDTRYLLYGQGENELSVNTFTDNLYNHNFSNPVICAALSDSGGFAVATKAEGYDSSVVVYDKNNNKLFEWFSSDETINSLALSPNGKTLAVSTLKVDNGKFSAAVHILKFDSANAVMKRTYEDDAVYQLTAVSNNTFCAVFSDNIEFLNFSKDTAVSNKSDYTVSIFKFLGGRVVALRTVAANQDQSILEVYKTNGDLVSSFNVNNYITDFSYKSGKLYLLGLSEIYKYDIKGELLATAEASYDALFIEAVSENSVACIRNSTIDKYTLTKTEG